MSKNWMLAILCRFGWVWQGVGAPFVNDQLVFSYIQIYIIYKVAFYLCYDSIQPVNDTDACIRVIDHWWSMTRIYAFVSLTAVNDTNQSASVSLTNLHSCHWPLYKGVQKSLVSAFVSLTDGQWHECTECDLHSAICIRVIDQTAFVSLTAL